MNSEELLRLRHFYAIIHVGGDDMSWRDNFEHTFDFIYKSVKKRVSDIRFHVIKVKADKEITILVLEIGHRRNIYD